MTGVSGQFCFSVQFIHAIVAAVCPCESMGCAPSLKADTSACFTWEIFQITCTFSAALPPPPAAEEEASANYFNLPPSGPSAVVNIALPPPPGIAPPPPPGTCVSLSSGDVKFSVRRSLPPCQAMLHHWCMPWADFPHPWSHSVNGWSKLSCQHSLIKLSCLLWLVFACKFPGMLEMPVTGTET